VKRLGWCGLFLTLALAACAQGSAPAPTSSAVPAASPKPGASAGASAAASKPAASAPASPAPGTVTVKAAYVPVVAFLALYRAIDKGYFADEGINMDLTVVQSASNAIAFAGSGQLDAAFGNIGDSFFNAVNRNVNVKVVGGMTYSPHDPKQTTSAPLVVRKQLADSGAVKSPADLKGRKVALNTTGGIQEYLLSYALQPAGLTVKDVDEVTMAFPDMVPAFKNGAVDAGSPAEPFLTNSLDQGYVSMLVPNPKPDALVTALLYGSNLLAPGKETVANGILKALRRASNELQTRDEVLSDENVAIWSKWSKISADEIRKEVVNVYAKDLAVDVSSVLDQQQVLLNAGRLEYKQPLAESAIFDARFMQKK
jgi:NitT/TauT family transport system substrate-binding protein